MKRYEIMTITKSSVGEEGARKVSNELKDTISNMGGKVLSGDFWGKRKFAYKIGQDTEGYYDVVDFEMSAKSLAELKKKLNIHESLLRYLITLAATSSQTGDK